MALLPMINPDGTLEDGTYIHLLPFCKKNCTKEKCLSYYEKLSRSNSGSYCCPYGLSSYVYGSPNNKIIFSGLKIREIYNKKKAKTINSDQFTYNPIISEENCIAIAREIAITIDEKNTLENKLDAIRDLLHETRSLNGQVKNTMDQLWENNNDEEKLNYDDLVLALKNVHVSSYMISNRFSYFDSVLNPTLTIGKPYSAVIFKKFDKIRKLLKEYMRKNVWISLNAKEQIDYRYNIFPTFETLLFIIFENAIKYSPNGKSVDVTFEEKGNSLEVVISSLGPYCDENEILHLCEKGFRGEYAKAFQQKGQGFGLSFAKKICEDHKIKINFDSVYSHKEYGVKYGMFKVSLRFESENTN